MDYTNQNLAVDGDSITAGEQWSHHVFKNLDFATHTNVAVGTAVWYKRRAVIDGVEISTEDYSDNTEVNADSDSNNHIFHGISDGWEEGADANEMQKRFNNCAIVHIQKLISGVKSGIYPVPDIVMIAMGTNDDANCLGMDRDDLICDADVTLSEADLYTTAGAMRWCISNLRHFFPNIPIYILTPIQTANHEHNLKLELQIEKVMQPIAKTTGCILIDCYHNCDIHESEETWEEPGRNLRDGLHPHEEGQKIHGDYVTEFLRQI